LPKNSGFIGLVLPVGVWPNEPLSRNESLKSLSGPSPRSPGTFSSCGCQETRNAWKAWNHPEAPIVILVDYLVKVRSPSLENFVHQPVCKSNGALIRFLTFGFPE